MSTHPQRILLLCFLLLTFSAVGQDRKLDKLEKLYTQESWLKLLRKADQLTLNSDYTSQPYPYLYKAIALSQIALDERLDDQYPFAMKQSVETYHDFKDRSSNQLVKLSLEQQTYLVEAWKSEALLLQREGKFNQAKYFETQLTACFNDSSIALPPPEVLEPMAPGIPTVALLHRDSIITKASQFIGVPYSYGGSTPSGFDCSGFTGYVTQQFGYQLPRTSRSQAEIGEKISLADAQKGDLIFFGEGKGSARKVTHVGIVVSEPGEPLKMIHSSSSRGVIITEVESSNYWKSRLLFVIDFISQ